MEHAARAQQQLHRASFYSGGSEDKRRGGDFLPSPFLEHGDPSKCVMWCAIALGALVQGAPVEKVILVCAASAAAQPRPRSMGDKCLTPLRYRPCNISPFGLEFEGDGRGVLPRFST